MRAALPEAERARIATAVWAMIERDYPVECDWILRDAGRGFAAWLSSPEGAETESAILDRALSELGGEGEVLRAEAGAAQKVDAAGASAVRLGLYFKACEARRASVLKPLLEKCDSIVFTKHYNLGGSHYAYTEGQSDAQNERHFKPGAALCVLKINGTRGTVTTLVNDPGGVIRDPDVSYDGERALFAWKKSDREDDYHLYELNLKTGAIRQLTFGLGFADYEGAYLPGGGIIFSSTRCVQTVDCWWTEVSNLYTCDGDGKYLRRLGFDQVHTNFPTVTDDGRILYTRWEYNDRGQIFTQPLFQMNQDGTGQTELYGNNSWFPTTILHARGIPGTQKVLAILSGHHCDQRGKPAIIDPALGRQEAAGVSFVAPRGTALPARIDAYGQEGEQFQYPYPIDDETFIAAYDPIGGGNRVYTRPYAICLFKTDGRRELLAWDPAISCNQPIPLVARPVPRAHPDAVDYGKSTGVFYAQDIYAGPGLAGVPRGTVKKLRVVKLEYRAAGIGMNKSSGPAGGALSSTPPSIDNGSWDVKAVLGDAVVREDGSACFTVPARTPVYFQAIDQSGRAVQTMRSWSTLQPGERYSCVGCHEHKNASPPGGLITEALKAGPQELEPFYGPPRGFSFRKEIQPVLDRHCIRCHNDRGAAPPRGARPDLADGKINFLSPKDADWRYTTERPQSGWEQTDFDDSGWKDGKAGFGLPGTLGGKIGTEWRSEHIWLRRAFKAESALPPESIGVLACHDEDVEVYLNGAPIARGRNYVTDFVFLPSTPVKSGVIAGWNTLAVHCRQTIGGQYIDVALVETTPDPELKNNTNTAFSLRGDLTPDPVAKRQWSDSYLALTGRGNPNRIVNWIGAQSIPPMLPPYYSGSVRSELIAMLMRGHNGVILSKEETDKLCCWIDLLVPYCGDYEESAFWNDEDVVKYRRFAEKRRMMELQEADNIKALIASRSEK